MLGKVEGRGERGEGRGERGEGRGERGEGRGERGEGRGERGEGRGERGEGRGREEGEGRRYLLLLDKTGYPPPGAGKMGFVGTA